MKFITKRGHLSYNPAVARSRGSQAAKEKLLCAQDPPEWSKGEKAAVPAHETLEDKHRKETAQALTLPEPPEAPSIQPQAPAPSSNSVSAARGDNAVTPEDAAPNSTNYEAGGLLASGRSDQSKSPEPPGNGGGVCGAVGRPEGSSGGSGSPGGAAGGEVSVAVGRHSQLGLPEPPTLNGGADVGEVAATLGRQWQASDHQEVSGANGVGKAEPREGSESREATASTSGTVIMEPTKAVDRDPTTGAVMEKAKAVVGPERQPDPSALPATPPEDLLPPSTAEIGATRGTVSQTPPLGRVQTRVEEEEPTSLPPSGKEPTAVAAAGAETETLLVR